MSSEKSISKPNSRQKGEIRISRRIQALCHVILLVSLPFMRSAKGQDTITGAFEGTVTNNLTRDPVEGARAEIINVRTGMTVVKTTDARGRFYQGLLPPDVYRVQPRFGFMPHAALGR